MKEILRKFDKFDSATDCLVMVGENDRFRIRAMTYGHLGQKIAGTYEQATRTPDQEAGCGRGYRPTALHVPEYGPARSGNRLGHGDHRMCDTAFTLAQWNLSQQPAEVQDTYDQPQTPMSI